MVDNGFGTVCVRYKLCYDVRVYPTVSSCCQVIERRVELLDTVADSVNGYCNSTQPELCCGLVDISPGYDSEQRQEMQYHISIRAIYSSSCLLM